MEKRKSIFKNPTVIAFILLYIIAVVLLGWANLKLLLSSILPISFASLALILLASVLTKNYGHEEFGLKSPFSGILFSAFCILLYYFYKYFPIPEFGGHWDGKIILFKLAILLLLPIIYLHFKDSSYIKFLFSTKNLNKDIKIGLIMGAVVVVPILFLRIETFEPLFSGEISLIKVIIAFPVSAIYFFLLAALPEEFFFRAFLQEHFSQLLKSRISGLIIVSFIFGFMHVKSLMKLYNISIVESFAVATMIQTPVGIAHGVIWEKTRTLIPLLILHTFIDAISNLMLITNYLYG